MIGVLWWLLEHWWLITVIAALALAWSVGGWRLALAVVTLGIGWRVYERGRRDGQVEIECRHEGWRDYLQEHYDEIDSRPRDPVDAYQRLRERSRDE